MWIPFHLVANKGAVYYVSPMGPMSHNLHPVFANGVLNMYVPTGHFPASIINSHLGSTRRQYIVIPGRPARISSPPRFLILCSLHRNRRHLTRSISRRQYRRRGLMCIPRWTRAGMLEQMIIIWRLSPTQLVIRSREVPRQDGLYNYFTFHTMTIELNAEVEIQAAQTSRKIHLGTLTVCSNDQ
jgi:hypothetical protein